MLTARVLAATLALGIGSLGLSACGGSQPTATQSAAPTATPTSRVSGSPDTWPLTGLPVPAGQSSVEKRPVLVLKMDNTPSSSPQLGLGSADMVVEELVEGGITRLAAFYYSKIPGKVGPVRSMRASDIGIVSPVHAHLVTSGAAAVTINRLRKAGIHYSTEGSPGFFRDSARIAPYNLFATLTKVAAATHQKPGRPVDYLPFGSAPLPSGPAAKTIGATFSGGHTTDWKYVGGHYVNENSYAAQGDTFAADNVLVLRVKIRDAGYLDPAGNHVPETDLTGTGQAMLFHGGSLVRATWKKKDLSAPLQLSAGGHDLSVPPGHTWIELVPAATGAVTFGK